MKKATLTELTKRQQDELDRLAALPDAAIDTSDIPETRDWSGATRGALFRPVKRQLTLRLDADLIEWFKRDAPGGRGYQTAINRALRAYVEARGRRESRE